ncbi:MAG: protein kinase [Candidatus Eisenbacteria bacterium]
MSVESGELAPGTRLGPYEIVALLGAGGMGEVYRAKDTRLGRDVAVKVVLAHLTADADLAARFEREARSVAALNHPHICALYDVGREGDREYIVMELLEGETLAARLARGPLPTADVLRFGTQIADALDRAHRQGLVHRDLKPGNVMLTKQGAKLLDFGLARPVTPGSVPGSSVVRPATPSTPTMSGPLTAAGAIVGTFQYMAPEQLEGGEADARSDLWALGAVLYQMATGQPAFQGTSQARLIASILTIEPRPISELVPLAPPALDRLVRACLAKDRDERIQTAHDVKLQLRWIDEGGSQAGVPAPVAAARRRHERLAWTVAAVAAAAALGLGAWIATRPAPRRQPVRFEIAAAPGARGFLWPRLSPDGSTLAYLAADSTGARRIHIRRLDTVEPVVLAGTEEAGRPFWSPDGSTLAFMVADKLKKVSSAGGPLQLVADARGRFDGTWGADGVILLDGGPGDSILAVSASGGAVKPATRLDRARGEVSHAWPSFLPDGKRFLFTVDQAAGELDLIQLGKLGSFDVTTIDSCDSRVEYVAPGYLLYARTGTLFARRFDLGSGKCRGEAFPVVENLGNLANSGDFSGSLTGTIAYRARVGGTKEQIVLVDRAGRVLETIRPSGNFSEVAPSPDGTRLVFSEVDERSGNTDLWVSDLRRGTTSRLTFDPGNDVWPVWSPDGQEIAFASTRNGGFRVWVKRASGVGEERRVPGQVGGIHGPDGWSAIHGVLTMSYQSNAGDWNVKAMSPRDSVPPIAISEATGFLEFQASISPDGRWVALASNESGRSEVYVQSYPVPSGRWQVSTSGGRDALWRQDGRELFYRTPSDTVMAVPVTPGETFDWGTAVSLFASGAPQGAFVTSVWQPTADGQRFYVLRTIASGGHAPISVVIEWAAEAAKRERR